MFGCAVIFIILQETGMPPFDVAQRSRHSRFLFGKFLLNHVRVVVVEFFVEFLFVFVGVSHCTVEGTVGVVGVVADCEIEPFGIACEVFEIFDFFLKFFFGACC